VNEISAPFAIENQRRGTKKFVVFQLLSTVEEGMYSVGEVRDRIREAIAKENNYATTISAPSLLRWPT